MICTFRERGKGRERGCPGMNDTKEGGHRIRIWDVGGHLTKHFRMCAKEKKYMYDYRAPGPQMSCICCFRRASSSLVRR